MIKLEHVVLPNDYQMEFIVEGMRNPLNSWEMSDSGYCMQIHEDCLLHENCESCSHYEEGFHEEGIPSTQWCAGKNDYSLMKRLANAGTDHRKFMRMIPVYVRITAPLYWWKEFDTYKVGTVANSCSTMHKIHDKDFVPEDFSTEYLFSRVNNEWKLRGDPTLKTLNNTIINLNKCRKEYLKTKDKRYWYNMIQLLPSSYNQTRNVMLNYEVLANMYKSRKNHKLDEWHNFCDWIETLPYSELITGQSSKNILMRDDMVEAINRSDNINTISSEELKTDKKISKVLVFKNNRSISEEKRRELQEELLKGLEDGVIVVPYYFSDRVVVVDRAEDVEGVAIQYENFNGGCK